MKLKRWTSGFLAAAMAISLVAPMGTVTAFAAADPVTDGLVLYSNFDDGTAADLSGSGNNGTVVGPLQFVEGKFGGKAVKFEGQNVAGIDYSKGSGTSKGNATGDQYVDYGKGISFGTGDFTLAMWYQSTGASSNATLFSNKNFESGKNLGWAMGDFADDLRMSLGRGNNTRLDINQNGTTSSPLYTAKGEKNVWHHLAVTVDRDGDMTYYVDGKAAASTAISSYASVNLDTGLPLVLGAGGNYCNATNNCIMDEVRVYNRALSAADVTAVYEYDATSPLEKDLVFYSNFDASNTTDLSGSGNDGTIVGDGVTFVDSELGGKAVKIVNKNAVSGGKNDDAVADSYINFGTDFSKDVLGANSFTVSFWYKDGTNMNSYGAVFGNKKYGSGNNLGMALGYYTTNSKMNFVPGAAGSGNKTEPKFELNQTGWHHFSVVIDAGNVLTIYQDGKKVSTSELKNNGSIHANLPFIVGASGDTKNPINNLVMDNLRIYNRALSLEDEATLFNQEKPDSMDPVPVPTPTPTPTPTPPPAALEKVLDVNFDDSSAKDLSGKGNNGTIVGEGVTFIDSELGGKALKIVNKDAKEGSANDDEKADSYINFGNDFSEKTLGANSFSIAFWYKDGSQMNNYGALFGNKDYYSGNNLGMALGYYPVNSKMNFVPGAAGGGNKTEPTFSLNNSGWHHFIVSIEAGKTMTIYQDGAQTASAAIKNSGSIHAGFPFVVGASGNLGNPITNLVMDNLCVYNSPVSGEQAKEIYAGDGVRLELASLLSSVSAIEPGSRYSAEAIATMKKAIEDAQAKLEGMDNTAAFALLDEVKAQYQEFAKGAKPKASFHLVSDVHVSNTTDDSAQAYIKGLQNIGSVNPDTNIAFVNVGDFTNNSGESEYKAFYDLTKQYSPFSAEETLILLGNHDVRGASGDNSVNWNRDPNYPEKCVNWPAAKARYQKYNADYMPAEAQDTLYHAKELGGYTFIMLNTELGLKDAMYMSDEQLAWFEETMKACYEKDPTKPVFIISHQALNNTHWRSNTLDGFDGIVNTGAPQGVLQPYNTGKDLAVKEVMAKYPVGIFLSGHIHNGLGFGEAVAREFGITVDVPSYNDSENGYTTKGSGFEVLIYDDEIVMAGYNYATNEYLPEYDISIKSPTASITYQEGLKIEKDGKTYTTESKAAFDAAMKELKSLLNRYYDQSGLAWNSKYAPTPFYYHSKDWDDIDAAQKALATAIANLEEAKPVEIAPAQDFFLAGGTDADHVYDDVSTKKAGTDTTAPYKGITLRVKNSGGDSAYNRTSVMLFDLSGAPESYTKGTLSLSVFNPKQATTPNQPGNIGKDFAGVSIYQVAGSELAKIDVATTTWNILKDLPMTKIGSITPDDVAADGYSITCDVSAAVEAARNAGDSKMALVFKIDEAENGKETYVEFTSTRNTEGRAAPSLALAAGEQKPDISKDDPEPYSTLRKSYTEYLLGGELDMTNEAVKTYIKNTNDTAKALYERMHKSDEAGRTTLFDNYPLTPAKNYWGNFSQSAEADTYTKSGATGSTMNYLRDIALAWATEGTEYYHDETVKAELISAVNHMLDTYFIKGTSGKAGGNWYHWAITAPTALMNIAMVMWDDLTQEQLDRWVDVASWYVADCTIQGPHSNDPKMTGGNLLLKANATLQTGILGHSSAILDTVKKGVGTVLVYNNGSQFYTKDADGFYKDGSYIQHQALAYIGGYGSDLYRNLGIFLKVLSGSDWEVTGAQVAFNTVFDGIEPFLYENRIMDMVSSRAVSRPGSSDKSRMAGIMNSILMLKDAFPTQEENDRFNSMMKYYLEKDPDYYFNSLGSISSIMKASEILADDSIQPRVGYNLTKTFTMDKTVHITDDFGFAISMHSDRTYGHELINSEGKRTWNTSDGMTYIYDEDVNQYGGDYWGAIDPKRLPGITAEQKDFGVGAGDRTKNVYDWTGGTNVDALNGVAGSHFRTLGGSSHTRNGTDVKKSWFMFGDKILALGAGITSSTGNEVNSIIENRKIDLDTAKITVDGKDAGLTAGTEATVQPSWMHLEGTGGSQIGYYFPQKTDINILKETRTQSWNLQGTSNQQATASFATFWFNHGAKPSNASYEYLLMPGATLGEMAAYAAKPTIEVLQNDNLAAAARDNEQNITGINFWSAGAVEGITSDQPASVMLKDNGDGTLTLAVSDPTQKQSKINVQLPYQAGNVVSGDSNVTISKQAPFAVVTVDTTGKEGATSTITFEAEKPVIPEVMSVTTHIPAITAPRGTGFKALGLPATVKVAATDSKTYEVEVKWERGSFNKNELGSFTITGQLVLPETLANTAGIAAKVSVTLVDPWTETLALEDSATRDGKYANDLATESSTPNAQAGTLAVKVDDTSYNRQAYIKLNLEGAPEQYTNATFKFQVTGVPADQYQRTDVYLVGNDWNADTLTWNNAPKRLSETPVASFGLTELNQSTVVELNLTEAVAKAIANGDKTLSLQFVNVGGGSKGGLYIYSLEAGSGVQKPTLIFSTDYTAEVMDKRNLQMLADTVDGLDESLYENYNIYEADLIKYLAEAQKVLDDPDATMADVHLAEDNLAGALLSLRHKAAKASLGQ